MPLIKDITMIEQWLPVAGYEGAYEVSNLGRLKSCARTRKTKGNGTARLKEKIRTPGIKREGYAFFCLYKDSKYKASYLHRLVASAFIENPLSHPQVNHIDGDKLNNRAENLEWVTASENCQHAIDSVLYVQAKGESAGSAVLTESDVLKIREMALSGIMHKDIAELFPVGRKAVTKIVNRQRWAHI